jgi:5'-3' exonuclease
VKVHLVDGTYELFRHHFGIPAESRATSELGGVRGVIDSLLYLIDEGATHLGVATDHVIESFRNDMWPSYKSSAGMDAAVLHQFGPLEEAISALGVHLWAMTSLEADDALASAASVAALDPRVTQVQIMTPDKDLAQCVTGSRVVQVDRRKRQTIDFDGVVAKFGVPPASIPDWLALVGDSADGFPGLPGWGAKTAAAVLSVYGHIDNIPASPGQWDVSVRGAPKLSAVLEAGRSAAALFLDLATLRVDPSLLESVDVLEWRGPTADFARIASELGMPGMANRAHHLAIAAQRRREG